MQYFGKDVALLGCEELTYRRFRVLLEALPTESRFKQASIGEAAHWDRKDHLMAALIDHVHLLDVHYLQAHGSKKAKFKPMKRPGVDSMPAGAKRYKGKALPLTELQRRAERTLSGGDD